MPNLSDEQEQKLQWAKEQLESGVFDGLDTHDIGRKLREAGLESDARQAFAKWFIERGMREGWLDVELGLV